MSTINDRTVSAATLRKRRQRAREKATCQEPPREVEFSRPDWGLFLYPDRLPQKAGCPRDRVRAMVLKEVVDNGLDAGATVSLAQVDGNTWVVGDDGPGLDRDRVLRYFAVNRPMISTKLIRRPTRGAVGNGLRVALGGAIASGGKLTVESRGVRYALDVDRTTGDTVVSEEGASEVEAGTRVTIAFGPALTGGHDDGWLACDAISAAGPAAEPMLSHPSWYTMRAYDELVQAAPEGTTVTDIARLMGNTEVDDPRPAAGSTLSDVLRGAGPPPKLLPLGPDFAPGFYAKGEGEPYATGAPVLAEAWVTAERCPPSRGGGTIRLFVNRSPVAAPVNIHPSIGDGLAVFGCNLAHRLDRVPQGGRYTVLLAVTSPFVPITTEGKEPDLRPFWAAVEPALAVAMRKAHVATRPALRPGDIKAAAYETMPEAYHTAAGSTGITNARQAFYVGRRLMLAILPEGTKIDDDYFTQHLLPDFIEDHPELTKDWNVVYDDRGHLVEPHTDLVIPCGTAKVRNYIRPRRQAAPALVSVDRSLYPTHGPENRYGTLLYIEKEGFEHLLREARIDERFDCAIISSKGMPVTSARTVVEDCAKRGVTILVAHDFDRAGAAIAHTLGNDTRRYRFKVPPEIVDIGLSLADAEAMGLDSEEAPDAGPKADALRGYGLEDREIDFLIGRHKRYELNAMDSDTFLAWIEGKLTTYGAGKVMPTRDALEEHARRVVARRMIDARVRDLLAEIEAKAPGIELPRDIEARVVQAMKDDSTLSWDGALEIVLADVTPEAGQ